MSKWIEFIQMRRTEKTIIWDVVTKDGGVVLGEIKWFGRWRKYSFYPKPETVYEQACLRDIAAFIDEQMAARRPAPEASGG